MSGLFSTIHVGFLHYKNSYFVYLLVCMISNNKADSVETVYFRAMSKILKTHNRSFCNAMLCKQAFANATAAATAAATGVMDFMNHISGHEHRDGG